MADEGALPRGPHSRKRVEDRLARPGLTPLAVEAEREAMRLVPDALEELEAG
jgi:hypothetical protein